MEDYNKLYKSVTTLYFLSLVEELEMDEVKAMVISDLTGILGNHSDTAISNVSETCFSIAEDVYDLQLEEDDSIETINETVEMMIEEVLGDDPYYQIDQQLKEIFREA